MQRRCPKCGEVKPIEDFARYSASRGGKPSYCKPCKMILQRQWRANGRNRDPETSFQRHLRASCAKFGITVETYQETLVAQGGVCAICKERASAYNAVRMALDHNHRTGKFRALLCGPCNTGLGMFQDDEIRLRTAAEYLALHKES